MEIAIADLDDCLLLGDSGDWKEHIHEWTESVLGESYRSSFRSIKKAIGLNTFMGVNEEVYNRMTRSDHAFAMTLRPFWRCLRRSTLEDTEDLEALDDVIMYPGKTLEGQRLVESGGRPTYLPLGEVNQYKAGIVEKIAGEAYNRDGESRILFFDNSEESCSTINDLDLDYVGIRVYDEDLNRYGD